MTHVNSVRVVLACSLVSMLGMSGCTRDSTRVAIETQRRVDEVQQAVFDDQHEALRVLLYRDLVHRLEVPGVELEPVQRETLNEVWNDRDLLEFWAIQNERAKALRVAGVDAKLFSDQSVIDLLLKSVEARFDRAAQGLAAELGEGAVDK